MVTIPRKSSNFVITVSFGGYNATGQTAALHVRLETLGTEPSAITLPLVVAGNGLSGTYTMTGSEIPVAGIYDAEARVTDGGSTIYYSAVSRQAIDFTDVLL